MQNKIHHIEKDEQIYFPEELKHFVIRVQDKVGVEKLIIKLSETHHLTFHFGMKSKEFDIHLKDETKSGDDKYKTLFKLSHSEGEILMNHCLQAMNLGFEKYWLSQRINIGKFHHHNCYFIQQDNVEKVLSNIVKESKNKIQLGKSISKSEIMKLVILPKDFEFHQTKKWLDVYRFRKGKSKHEGFIWYPNGVEGRKPYFVSRKNSHRFNQLIIAEFLRKSIELKASIDEDFKSTLMQKVNSKYLINSAFNKNNV